MMVDANEFDMYVALDALNIGDTEAFHDAMERIRKRRERAHLRDAVAFSLFVLFVYFFLTLRHP